MKKTMIRIAIFMILYVSAVKLLMGAFHVRQPAHLRADAAASVHARP